jgi:hypothetical protein
MWTSQHPTKNGYYWCKCKGVLTGRIYVTIVKVTNDGKNVFWDGENFTMNSDDFIGWWNEPVKEPPQ